MSAPRVLVACEFSGTVRDAFLAAGFDAWSCDLLPTESPGPHRQCDVREILGEGWDLMIAHPPCTYLASSGLHWNSRNPERAIHTEDALAFVKALLDAPIPRIALENPVGCISSRIRPPSQIVQPWHFGHNASKATCFWLKGLPPLLPTEIARGRMVAGKVLSENQTDSGQNNLAPSADRWKERSRTYKGLAAAMAHQWGTFLTERAA